MLLMTPNVCHTLWPAAKSRIPAMPEIRLSRLGSARARPLARRHGRAGGIHATPPTSTRFRPRASARPRQVGPKSPASPASIITHWLAGGRATPLDALVPRAMAARSRYGLARGRADGRGRTGRCSVAPPPAEALRRVDRRRLRDGRSMQAHIRSIFAPCAPRACDEQMKRGMPPRRCRICRAAPSRTFPAARRRTPPPRADFRRHWVCRQRMIRPSARHHRQRARRSAAPPSLPRAR